jgi:anti-sigma factor RsiW
MDEPLCQWLDDFLAHDLVGDERQRFVDHLAVCQRCGEAVSEQRRIVGRLREALDRLEPAPAVLAGHIERRIQTVRRRRIAVAAIALAASIALFALWLQTDHTAPSPSSRRSGPTLASNTPPVRVTFPARNVIAVPVESESPNVTVLMVYPVSQNESPSNPERNER